MHRQASFQCKTNTLITKKQKCLNMFLSAKFKFPSLPVRDRSPVALSQYMSTIAEHVTELEQRVSANEDTKDNSYLKEKIKDLENRSRSHNLRFLHVPEQTEGRDMLEFMNKLIPLLLDEENFTSLPVIERAHRSPTTRRQMTKTGPRPILVKFLLLQDKVKLLRLAQAKRELFFNGCTIHIYPDYSAWVLQKWREFNNIKKKLRELNIKYSLLYLATLKVIIDGKSRMFRYPGDIETFLRDDMSSP
uniref:L1 transposable element RRM domain-containing protein n=1 Tax=Sparus aurata TaxID=8175 RepID=A0A671WIR9_SPAAU